jgi:hypothetical protein
MPSKSADLRVLGVQLPLPAPTLKPARDAGLEQIGNLGIQPAEITPKLSCDAVVTGRGRTPAQMADWLG